MPETLAFVDRKGESQRLENAIRNRQSLMICGPAGIGKSALVRKAIHSLPRELAARCLCIGGTKDLKDLLRQLVRKLYVRKDAHLRHQLHAEGVSVRTFEPWLQGLSTGRLKGAVYQTVESGDYRVFLDHLPPLTRPVAKVIKELFWMRNTPVYLLMRDEADLRLDRFSKLFYWGDNERLALPPLPAQAAADLLERCIERFALSRLDLRDFREEVPEFSKRVPGAIVKICRLASDPRYQYGSQIKTKSVYINYLIHGGECKADGLD